MKLKRLRNSDSARRSRLRKNLRLKTLEAAVLQLERRNQELLDEVNRLRSQLGKSDRKTMSPSY
jgi:hypothetical protein